MTATITTEWSYRGLQALILENALLRVVVLPELGGKIWEIHDTGSGRQFLWHNERVAPQRVPFGSAYDDVFHGGWDVLFPNDIPEVLGGEQFPDHGELWSIPWEWEITHDSGSACVEMSVRTPVSACLVSRRIELRVGERALRIRESVCNESGSDLPYLWKQHLSVEVGHAARIDLPAGQVRLEDFGRPRVAGGATTYTWPMATEADGTTHDMRETLPRSSRVAEFQYATNLADGWCATTFADGSGIALTFDPQVFPHCWTFVSYGGWREHQVAILEPCSGYPISVVDGVEAGTHRVLPAGSRIETELIAVTYRGLASVEHVSRDGRVVGGEL